MKVLITAFDPFGDDTQNSAYLAMDLLPDKTQKHEIVKETLPVVYNKCADRLKSLIEKHRPNGVICLGQAADTASIRIERLAVNLDDTDFADNEGNIHIDKVIAAEGPAAYFATLPTREMLNTCLDADIPAHLSYTAGNYVCNHTMYSLLHYIKKTNTIGGFIHIPITPNQAKQKNNMLSMSSKDAAAGLLSMIDALWLCNYL